MKSNSIISRSLFLFLIVVAVGTEAKWIWSPEFPSRSVGDLETSWDVRGGESGVQGSAEKIKDVTGSDDSEGETTYVGAVFEYEPDGTWTDEERGYGVLRRNARKIEETVAMARMDYRADILVIPEYGLTSLDIPKDDLSKFLTYTLYVPDPSVGYVPCSVPGDKSNHLEALKILSCAAQTNQLYLVINVAELYPCSEETVKMAPWPMEPSEGCPESGYIFYNCEVVLDRNGAVIARYRKQNLFMEDIFTPGPKEDTTPIFLTDFNVLFTLQTCFDMVYSHPGYSNVKYLGIRDVAMSTAWADYLPFEIADEAQSGWSKGLKTNLLVAGHHKPELGKLGSGIYREYSGRSPVNTYDKDSGDVLLAANVTTIKATQLMPRVFTPKERRPALTNAHVPERSVPHTVQEDRQDQERRHLLIHENLENYTKVLLEPRTQGETVSLTACSYNNFCCDLSYQYTGNLTYMFLVYSGKFKLASGRYVIAKQVCGVLWCRTTSYNTCAHIERELPGHDQFGPISISSSSFKAESITTTGIHRDLSLLENKQVFQKKGYSARASIEAPISDLMVYGLYGRWFCEDGM